MLLAMGGGEWGNGGPGRGCTQEGIGTQVMCIFTASVCVYLVRDAAWRQRQPLQRQRRRGLRCRLHACMCGAGGQAQGAMHKPMPGIDVCH